MINDKNLLHSQIVIDFLYLDLNTCDRCVGSNSVLDEAISDVSNILKDTGVKVIVNKVNVNSEFLAYQYKFMSSPTIRVNGHDIQMDIKENNCESCGSICGSKVDCRVWVYNGIEYTIPPKTLIIEEILKEVSGSRVYEPVLTYELPENLKKFYASRLKKRVRNCKLNHLGKKKFK